MTKCLVERRIEIEIKGIKASGLYQLEKETDKEIKERKRKGNKFEKI